MNKVFDFMIDEDSNFVVNEFNNVEDFISEMGLIVGRMFSGKFNYNNEDEYYDFIDKIDIESNKELFDFDGGELEYNKFKDYVEKINEFVSNNNDYIIVSYSVEYDVSFLVIKRVDFDKLVELSVD